MFRTIKKNNKVSKCILYKYKQAIFFYNQNICHYYYLLKVTSFVFAFLTVRESGSCQIITNKVNDTYIQNLVEKYWRQKGENVDFSIKPYYIEPEILDSILKAEFEIKAKYFNSKGFFKNTLRGGNMLFYSDNEKNSVSLNPIINFSAGNLNNGSQGLLEKDFGLQLDIRIGKKLFISSSSYESNSVFPNYIRQYSDSLRVVPGMGWARKSGNTYNYNIPYAHVGYKLNSTFYFEIGNDKNHIGSGYRSLLLSDFAFNYPYIKIITNLGDFKYTNIWTQFVDASNNFNSYNLQGSFPAFPKKYASFNYLTYTGLKKWQISAFQSMIWVNHDSLGNSRPQEWGYFVPIIYLNSLNFNNGSPDNSVMGFDVNYQIKPNIVAYGQLIIDDLDVGKLFKTGTKSGFFQEKYGFQAGVKMFDAFGIKNSFIQVEYNTVRPYTYANKVPMINYTHYNEALADPLGANFKELIVNANYRFKRWLFTGEILYSKYGSDSMNSNWGNNIHLSDYTSQLGIFSYGNKIGQGITTTLLYVNLGVNYLMNPITNSRFNLQITLRNNKKLGLANTDNIFMIGYSTNLRNVYKDF